MNANKKLLKESLEQLGFEFKKRSGTAETFISGTEVGNFTVWIVLSNKARVLVETNGTGSYYINVIEHNLPFNDVTASDLKLVHTSYVTACKAFNNIARVKTLG